MQIIIPDMFDKTYDELVECFLNKHGAAKYDYFHTPECKSFQKKNSRTKEGLEIHHIDENRYPDLSEFKDAPFECQKADRLVYVNVLEHLLLHIKIDEECKKGINPYNKTSLGHPGIIWISERINGYFMYSSNLKGWNLNMFKVISDYFDDYVAILTYYIRNLVNFYPNKKLTIYNEIRDITKHKGQNYEELHSILIKYFEDNFNNVSRNRKPGCLL